MKQARSEKTVIKARQHITPFQQGKLDGLCGVYATINAIALSRWLHQPVTKKEANQLFEAGLYHLNKFGDLAEIVRYGMSHRRLASVSKRLASLASRNQLSVSVMRVDRYLSASDKKRLVIESLGKQFAVVTYIEREYHYSVVSGYSEKKFQLFDSLGRSFQFEKSAYFDFAWIISCKG